MVVRFLWEGTFLDNQLISHYNVHSDLIQEDIFYLINWYN